MELKAKSHSNTRNTILFSLLLLFFIQLFGMWIESIYRMSLIKLAPGGELFGVLLLLLPLAMFLVNERREQAVLWLAILAFLGARLLCPSLGAEGQIIVGGVGLSMFLVILAYSCSVPYSTLKGDMGLALGLAVLMSAALRAWGSSLDISTEATGSGFLLGGVLTGIALVLFCAAVLDGSATPLLASTSMFGLFPAMVGLFANLALVYLVFASPAVVCAWSGYAQLGSSGVYAAACLAVPMAMAIVLLRRNVLPGRFTGAAWNGVLFLMLAGGLYAGRPAFPESSSSAPVYMTAESVFTGRLHYLALLLAPVVIFNVRHLEGLVACARPRKAVLPILAGMGGLFALTMLLIFSNVWGYVPLGSLFRNRFYLPFLLAGTAIFLPWLVRPVKAPSFVPEGVRLLGGMAVLLAALGVAGAIVHVPRVNPSESKTDLTVLTYNMQQGSHANGNRNYRNQLALLHRLGPDIIGLQECDTARPSGGNVDSVRYFAESLGYHAYYGPGAIAGTFGAAILSRYPIKNARAFFTYSTPDEVGTAVAEIIVGDTPVAFFSTHPAGGEAVMSAFVNALKAEADGYAHVISVGDYNFTAREPYFASLSQALQDSATQLGESRVTRHGGTRALADEIDHIFASGNFRTVESHYLPPPDSGTDHPAHWSVLRME